MNAKRRLRERSEHYLMLAAIRQTGAGAPKSYKERGGLLWRFVFVPLYRRVPWAFKQRAMNVLRMTSRGWTPPPRAPREPWRPPPRQE
jgi:hypothetical protein